MSTTGRFDTDVFLSFAGPDDASVMPGEAGWVTGFRTALGAFAQQILGRPLTLCTADEAEAGIGPIGSATFVAILSPGYLQAPERLADLTTFADTAAIAAGPAGGDERRIFKIVKTPVQPDETPGPLKACLEYAFFDLDETTGVAREFRAELGPEAKQRFLSKTYELAQDLCALVTQLQETGAVAADAPATTPEAPAAAEAPAAFEAPAAPASAPVSSARNGARTIYLAQTASDQKEARDLVRGELLQLGHRVLPDQDLPLEAEGLRAEVEAALEQCDLAVHLIGSSYGIVPEGASESIVALQCELAGARSKERRLARLVWIAPDSQPSDERQEQFATSLETEAVAHKSTDVLRTPLEALKTAIRDTLANLEKGEREVAGGDHIYIYVICDEKDYRATKPVEDFLRKTGFDVWVPAFEGEASEIREVHKQNLLDCDANIVFYGEASDTWFQMKLIDWRKMAGWGRKGRMLAKAIYVGSPLTDHKRRLRAPDVLVIENRDAFSEDVLQPFLDEIKRRKTGGP